MLGNLIRLGRKERKMTEKDLADRTGISRGTLQKIEKGDMRCEIGLFFETAAIVGVALFDDDISILNMHNDRINDKIALLPKRVRKKEMDVDDDF